MILPHLSFPGFGDLLTAATRHNEVASCALTQLRSYYNNLPLRDTAAGPEVYASEGEESTQLNRLFDTARQAESAAVDSMQCVRAALEETCWPGEST